MRELKISIEKARISSFTVALADDDKPRVIATIDLLGVNGEFITNYSISTDNYDEKKKFELPLTLIGPIKKMLDGLEQVVTFHCENRNRMIEETSSVETEL